MNIVDVLVVGGGPCGLASAIEAKKQGLSHVILEKGSVTQSIRQYPRQMRFFSTAENIEIGDIPFPTLQPKATRDEALQYYRKVTTFYQLNLRLYTEVTHIGKENDVFQVMTRTGEVFVARNVVIATGYFDFPRMLNIPGENLPHVSHYYDEPFKSAFTKVVIVGGGNSAIEAALELYRHDVDVTVVHMLDDFTPTAKYWLIPDMRNRVKAGKIKTLFNHVATAIEPGKIHVKNPQTGEERVLAADFVYLLVGYLPDAQLLKQSGIELNETLIPAYDPDTFETNVDGLYVCGTVVAGIHTEKVFIENGRVHAKAIAAHIAARQRKEVAIRQAIPANK